MSIAVQTPRPTQPLRQRRESGRPGIARISTRGNTVDATDGTPPPPVPFVKTQDYILRKFNGKPPSLVIHLHQTHFRFDQQDGNFAYNSPMSFILKHLRDGTVPHEMTEQLLMCNVEFYDGCLIVEVHDHKSGAGSNPAAATNQVGGTNQNPFSVHNYNEHITPSAFVPYPVRQRSPQQVMKSASASVKSEKDGDKDNMPAPGQPASASQKKNNKATERVFTVVLFPTQQTFQEELSILGRTPLDARKKSRDGATPGQPPTPMTSVPPTPSGTKGQVKEIKMAIDENNVHDFEADYLRVTEVNLCLRPAKDAEDALDILKMLEHPQHMATPPTAKTRKRTVAQLAADEEQAAKEERFMLSLDDRQAQATGAAGGSSNEASSSTATHEPFKRFKALETIKQRHLEQEREKKEQEARDQLLKQQQKAELEAARRKQSEQLAREQQMMTEQQEQAKLQIQTQQHTQMMQQQAAAASARAKMAQAAQNSQMTNQGNPPNAASMASQMIQNAAQHQMQQHSQAQAMSPIIRQQTPLSQASPTLNGVNAAMGVTSAAMVPSASQGIGSPARPPSAVSHHPGQVNMARQASQQQMSSAHGTPQMSSTPFMNAAALANRASTTTPQPGRVNQQGSPVVNGMGGTPMMPTSSMQGMTPEQQAHRQQQMNQLRMQQQQHAAQQQQQQQQMLQAQGMSAQQAAMLRQQMQNNQQAAQNPMAVQQQQNVQMQQQMAMQNRIQQMQMAQAGQAASSPAVQNMQLVQQQQAIQQGMQRINQAMQMLHPTTQSLMASWKVHNERKLLVQIQKTKLAFLQQKGNSPAAAQAWMQIEQAQKMKDSNIMLGQLQQLVNSATQNGGQLPPGMVNQISANITAMASTINEWRMQNAQRQAAQQQGATPQQQQQQAMNGQQQSPGMATPGPQQQQQQQNNPMANMMAAQTSQQGTPQQTAMHMNQMNPAYMQQLRQHQVNMQRAQQQQAAQQAAQANNMNLQMNMGGGGGVGMQQQQSQMGNMNMLQQAQMQQMMQAQQQAQAQQQQQMNQMQGMGNMGGMMGMGGGQQGMGGL